MIAGCDIILMPSRFEPCGLNQLFAMRYGTIPIAHATGGLRDTIDDYNPYAGGTPHCHSYNDTNNSMCCIALENLSQKTGISASTLMALMPIWIRPQKLCLRESRSIQAKVKRLRILVVDLRPCVQEASGAI